MSVYHAQNAVYHVTKRIQERFTVGDFTSKTKKYGNTNFAKETIDAIVNAPKIGKKVEGGKGCRNIYRVQVFLDLKPVYVVWDMFLNLPVTILTSIMYTKSYG